MIELKNITLSYGKDKKVLDELELCIPSGQIIGLVGKNGVGKTSLLKTMMGFLVPEQGTITVDGLPVKEQYDKLIFITEEGSCFSYMNALQYGTFLKRFYEKFSEERYEKMLDFFQVDKKAKYKRLSKGQKAKVEIAAGFSKGGRYILMDEPFLGKDVFSRKDFLKMIATQIEEESVLIATHELSDVEKFLDRILILHDGKIAKDWMREEHPEWSLIDVFAEVTGYDSKRYKMLL